MTPAAIRAFRKSLGLSAEAFASAVGVSDGRLVRRWESGEVSPTGCLAVIVELAEGNPAIHAALVARAVKPQK